MAIPANRKPCICSVDCLATLRIDSSWKYARGHSAAKRSTKNPEAHSFVEKSGNYYSACLAILATERDLLTKEIDRLEDQAVAAEKTAKAARDLAADVATKHEVIIETITNLNLLLGIVPQEA
ncbi:MAG TPA: hypothetical protein VGU67_03055 [Edaphobacter sp.]|nr:hypothetical protein [Edaphobacter sp.]